jgi:hypothetical protein
MNATSSRSSGDAFRSITRQRWRRAASWSRASASTVTASGPTPLTSQRTTSEAFVARRPQTRSHKPGRSSRAIGP